MLCLCATVDCVLVACIVYISRTLCLCLFVCHCYVCCFCIPCLPLLEALLSCCSRRLHLMSWLTPSFMLGFGFASSVVCGVWCADHRRQAWNIGSLRAGHLKLLKMFVPRTRSFSRRRPSKGELQAARHALTVVIVFSVLLLLLLLLLLLKCEDKPVNACFQSGCLFANTGVLARCTASVVLKYMKCTYVINPYGCSGSMSLFGKMHCH